MKKFLNKIIEACDPIQVFIFGSMAKGTNHSGSDIDFFIIVDDFADVELIYTKFNQSKILDQNDFIIRKSSEFEKNKNDISTIDLVVNLEGKLIYSNNP